MIFLDEIDRSYEFASSLESVARMFAKAAELKEARSLDWFGHFLQSQGRADATILDAYHLGLFDFHKPASDRIKWHLEKCDGEESGLFADLQVLFLVAGDRTGYDGEWAASVCRDLARLLRECSYEQYDAPFEKSSADDPAEHALGGKTGPKVEDGDSLEIIAFYKDWLRRNPDGSKKEARAAWNREHPELEKSYDAFLKVLQRHTS